MVEFREVAQQPILLTVCATPLTNYCLRQPALSPITITFAARAHVEQAGQ